MKKINAFFISLFLIALLSACQNVERIKYIEDNPDLTMGSIRFLPSSGEIHLDDSIELILPENAADAALYYEIAVGTECLDPTEASTKYTGPFTLSDKGLSAENDDFITLKVLAVKSGFARLMTTQYWRFSDGSAAVIDNNAYLKSVTISSPVSNVYFAFSPETYVYDDIKVPNTVGVVNIDYEKFNTNATVETSPSSLKSIQLNMGESTMVTLTVTSADKTTKKRYTFNIYRAYNDEVVKSNNAELISLSVTGASISFDPSKVTYEVQLPNSTEKTSVKYTLSDSKAKVVSDPSDLENISLQAGNTKTVTIKVTAEDGITTKTYTISIYRQRAESEKSADATLKSLSVTGAELQFNSSTTDYNVRIDSEGTVSVKYEKNHPGATVITIPSNVDVISVPEGGTTTVTITVTAENEVATKTYKINLRKPAGSTKSNNANLASIQLSAGSLPFDAETTDYSVVVDNSVLQITVSASAADSKATVNISPSQPVSLTAGSVTKITITVTAEDGSFKEYTISVTRKTDSSGNWGGQSEGALKTEYYWTNKDGAVGTSKTISSWSDWTEKEKIAQSAAYDDPRTWRGIQEVSYDAYALYAAWDSSNLYLMVELTNIVGQMANGNGFMWHDYAASDNACWWNRNIPLGFAFNTGIGVTANSPAMANNDVVWGGINFTDEYGFDVMMYHSSKWGNDDNKGGAFQGVGEPFFGKTTSSGEFSYDSPYCKSYKDLGIEIHFKDGCAVSKQVYYEATPKGNRAESRQTGQSLVDSTNYKAVTPDGRCTSYWYKIPFTALGIDRTYLENTGIGVRQLTTGGGSLMDCIPWDVSMVDVANDPCSQDESTSAEKEDTDELTTPYARIGH
ncbi:MAG: cadherin-like beta sandwich domain-containing protein [Spirochaetales bacterium]|nr:cadherin-like beta sandwich domain-containing protein [Spirochaetales bacterium]